MTALKQSEGKSRPDKLVLLQAAALSTAQGRLASACRRSLLPSQVTGFSLDHKEQAAGMQGGTHTAAGRLRVVQHVRGQVYFHASLSICPAAGAILARLLAGGAV